jgi:DNA-binding transcriptional MocR family regulator
MVSALPSGSAPLYERLATHVEDLVRRGTFRPGDRIPSVREATGDFGVSPATVIQAYQLLEGRGIVEPRPRSGYYVRLAPPTSLPEPAITAPPNSACRVNVCDLVQIVFEAERSHAYAPFGGACPNIELYPAARLARILGSLGRRAKSSHGYDFPPGAEPLRRQIARRATRAGARLAPDDIVTTCGAAEALHLALRAVARPGDVIALESPTYFGVLSTIESLGMVALELPTHPRDGLDLAALEKVLQRRRIAAVVAMPCFQNPVGFRMSDESKERLVGILARHEVPLIEDDIYGDLGFEDRRPLAAKAFDRHGLVLTCSSFSKTLAPGYRVGWIVPGRWRDAVVRLKLMTTIATATLPQLAVAEYLETGEYERHLRRLRRVLQRNVACGLDAVARFFPPGTRVTRPAGGFVLWVELPSGVDAIDLHRRALADRISICPGPMFSSQPRYGQFVRLSCGVAWSDRLDDAMRRLGKLAAA